MSNVLTLERLHELLQYDVETGIFVRKVSCGAARKGRTAGTDSGEGHLRVKIDGRDYLMHRLAWLYCFGEWPRQEIDHKNGVRNDNRLGNLRDVPSEVNRENVREKIKPSAKSTYLGVCWLTKRKKFLAQISVKRKVVFLGHFDDAVEAHEAYLKAKRQLHVGCTI